MAKKELAELIGKEQLKSDIFKITMKAPEIVKDAKPGHFIQVRVSEQVEPFLRRPISIYNMDKENGILEMIFQVKGKGTEILSKKEIGTKIDLLGPLGNREFRYDNFNNLAVIGGGIGVFPLYELAKSAKKDDKNVNIYLGFRSKEFVVLEDEFKKVADEFTLTTDDGSYAKEGFAITYLEKDIDEGKVDSIYACGPLPMLKAVQKLALEKDIPCQLSLEERMGCGVGVCLGCAVKKAGTPEDAPDYWHVCKAGPVFEAKEVEI